MFFLIDSSGSMDHDINVCAQTYTQKEWNEYIKSVNYFSRIKLIKEVLKKKIEGFPDKQKYFIWESNGSTSFDNLDGSKSKNECITFVDGIIAGKVFKYEDAFKALAPKIEKLDNSQTIVSLLTDGGISNEDPSKLPILSAILSKGIKKWELYLYTEGGCTDPETAIKEQEIMDELKKTVGIKSSK